VDYIGNIVYKNDKIDYIQTAEGRFVYETNGSVHYEFYAKDHLGNVRATYTRSPLHPHNVHVTQLTDYYPFGLPHVKPNGTNTYLYNGKEIDNEINMYHYGARLYDPVLGRFPSLDPLSDKFVWVSPYNYAENSPIANIDLWGLQKFSVHLLESKEGITAISTLEQLTTKDKLIKLDIKNMKKDEPGYNTVYRNVRHHAKDFSYSSDEVRQKKTDALLAKKIFNDAPTFSLHTDNVSKEPEYEELSEGILKGGFEGNTEGQLDFSNLSLGSEDYDKIDIFTSGDVTIEDITNALNDIGLDTEGLVEPLSNPKKGDHHNVEVIFYRIIQNDNENK